MFRVSILSPFIIFWCCSDVVFLFCFLLLFLLLIISVRGARRYQRGSQNPYIEEKQITQWPKEKVQKDKQRSTKQTHKTKDRVTRTPLKIGGELRCPGRVSRYCSTSDTCSIILVTNPVTSHDWGKDREVFTTSGTYLWSFVTQIFHNEQVMVATAKLSKW